MGCRGMGRSPRLLWEPGVSRVLSLTLDLDRFTQKIFSGWTVLATELTAYFQGVSFYKETLHSFGHIES